MLCCRTLLRLTFFLTAFLFSALNGAFAQAEHRRCGTTTCAIYSLSLKSQKLELLDRKANGQRFASLGELESWGKEQSKNLLFATNAGIFSKDYLPLGLFAKEGIEIVPLNIAKGEGNFFLKPNGVFALSGGKAEITETSKFHPQELTLASQSGPLLVERGSLHPEFRKDSSNRTIRNGVGVKNEFQIIFAISDGPINFYDFAIFFRDSLGCNDALYLDGYISQMFLPEIGRRDRGGNFAAIFAVFENTPVPSNLAR